MRKHIGTYDKQKRGNGIPLSKASFCFEKTKDAAIKHNGVGWGGYTLMDPVHPGITKTKVLHYCD